MTVRVKDPVEFGALDGRTDIARVSDGFTAGNGEYGML